MPSAIMPSLSQQRSNEGIHQNVEMGFSKDDEIDIDIREVYFLIMHFLSSGPCHRTYGQLWNELLEHKLLPRRYHAWYSRKGLPSGDEDDDGLSFPLNYSQLAERYPHIERNHLLKLLKELLRKTSTSDTGKGFTGADVPTLLGSGSFSLLESERKNDSGWLCQQGNYLRWPHSQANQVHALRLREIGGGFAKHHRAPSIRAACYAIAKPSILLQRMERIKTLRGHINAVYCAIFDRSGQYVISGSDDRLVKIWSMETGFCLASCRGHEGDITDLAVSINNVFVASASNDCIIRIWRLPDGLPVSVLRGHTAAVTAIAFSPRPGCEHHLLSSSDDGSCRIWDARDHHINPRVYIPKPEESIKPPGSKGINHIQTVGQRGNKILCCAFNASGTIFVTGSSDNLARVWSAVKRTDEVANQPHYELDILSGHENDVNYVQFSGTAVPARLFSTDSLKEESLPKLKNICFTSDNIVTCSRDGSAIIWIPRSRKSQGRAFRWTKAYHLKVPPPPMPPQQPRGGPRQRTIPTPRGVNMIVWSLDNRFVLAAIMDCRICVWNAADGSLVHSLTGHTESTYVLDVHPFDPRIAMSAGYDGKTFVWDIWKGVPIKVYEIGPFKLVDGKFSPDGTSVVLSDDVGTIHILGTGDGQSQRLAKDDQFFLGDYLNLTQDVNGNVVDQETMLPPYRRNLQDLLCDAGRIPYPEPYQSMYQQRRLGSLGIDWHPPSFNLAVGPGDAAFYTIRDDPPFHARQINANRGRWLDYPAELADGLDWDQENENQSDDTGSEYNVNDESSSEGLQASLNEDSLQKSENSAEEEYNSDSDSYQEAHFHSSTRQKRKAEETMYISCGKRVRRKASEQIGNRIGIRKIKESRQGKSIMRGKSMSEKRLRPQRRAARNALQFFSAMEEEVLSDDEYEEENGDYQGSDFSDDEVATPSHECQSTSSSERQMDFSENNVSNDTGAPESHSQPSSSGRQYSLRNEEVKAINGSLRFARDETKDDNVKEPVKPKLLLKFKCSDSKNITLADSSKPRSGLKGMTSSLSGVTFKEKQPASTPFYDKSERPKQYDSEPRDTGYKFEAGHQVQCIENKNVDLEKAKTTTQAGHENLSAYEGMDIWWGEAKARRSKRPRMNECNAADLVVKPKLISNGLQQAFHEARGEYHTSDQVPATSQEKFNDGSCKQRLKLKVGSCSTVPSRLNKDNSFTKHDALLAENNTYQMSPELHFNTNACVVDDDWNHDKTCSQNDSDENSPLLHFNTSVCAIQEDWSQDIASRPNGYASCNPGNVSHVATEVAYLGEDARDDRDYVLADDLKNYRFASAGANQNRFGKVMRRSKRPKNDSFGTTSEEKQYPKKDHDNLENVVNMENAWPRKEISTGNLPSVSGSRDLHVGEDSKLDCNFVKNECHADDEQVEASDNDAREQAENSEGRFLEGNKFQTARFEGEQMCNGSQRLRSKRTKHARNFEKETKLKSKTVEENFGRGESARYCNRSFSGVKEVVRGTEWGSTSKNLCGVKDYTDKKGTTNSTSRMLTGKNVGNQTVERQSWLMLYEAEPGLRYIPQLGDEVAYVRQGHEEFLSGSPFQERGPWKSIKGNIRFVEFCCVIGLEYSTVPGSGETCCKLTLRFIDPSSDVHGKTFKLNLPELTHNADFLVEKSRYEASLNRNWTIRDKCKVWWKDDKGEGAWYDGRITSVKPTSDKFPDSPWDRYHVLYKCDSTETQKHSPWELFDLDDCSGHEQPQIDPELRNELLQVLEEMEKTSNAKGDRYGLGQLAHALEKPEFLNRIPLPLSLDIIMKRLENDYYRRVDAFMHDIQTMVSNAQSYFTKDTKIIGKLQRFEKKISAVLEY